jgi:basic amino acid/polyamine antiporter, APA family
MNDQADPTSGGSGGTKTQERGLRRAISRPMLTFFIIGDILGTGIYALVGEVGADVGGAIWVSFLVAIVAAFITAFSYAELVTKYPRASGAALYANKAFRIPFVTFMVGFAIVMSGLTSASAAAVTVGGDYLAEFVTLPTVLVAIVTIALLSLVNAIGVRESVRLNLGFTAIELTGLLIIILIGVFALVGGTGEPSRAFEFKEGVSAPLAALSGGALAFFAMVGFEDSVNMAEETHEPSKVFPPALFIGLAVTGIVYMLVAFTASMVVETQQLADSSGPLLEVIEQADAPVPGWLFSLIALIAVSNSALINLMMGSRLLYGMANQGILPSALGRVHPSRRTPILAIIFLAVAGFILVASTDVESLGATTAALLLAVFTLVNIAALVLRRDKVDHEHFVAPTFMPVLGVVVSVGLLTRQEGTVLVRGLVLLAIGVALWGLNALISSRVEMAPAEGAGG